jgi:hypothetical protein
LSARGAKEIESVCRRVTGRSGACLPPECGILEIGASGDFADGVLILETSEDGSDPVAAPIRGSSSQRLNVKPCCIRPRIEGGSYSTTVLVSLTARR